MLLSASGAQWLGNARCWLKGLFAVAVLTLAPPGNGSRADGPSTTNPFDLPPSIRHAIE